MRRKDAKGQCLCGSVVLHVPSLDSAVAICHCSMCRQWVGGPFFSIECGDSIRIDGEEYLGVYSSSEWAERVFCKKCGSALFYRLKEDGHIAVSAGIFEPEGFHLAQQIFIDEKPCYYEFANVTPKLTGAEAFSAYKAKKDNAP
jgi:hypothetical protein